jgi:hypothetical protein
MRELTLERVSRGRYALAEIGTLRALPRFAAGSGSRPVSASVENSSQLEPLLLLFCCHVVKQAADTAKVGAVAGTEAAIGG